MPSRRNRSRALRSLAAIVLALAGAGLASTAGALVRRPPNVIQVSAPAAVKPKAVYDVTLSGYARRRAKAYLFIDYQRCANSFTVEHARAAKESQVYPVTGSFAKTSGWRSADRGVDHACAYLVSASGSVLARAVRSYPVK